MKVTINLSPAEIQKLGKLTNATFNEGWNKLMHTEDDVIFAVHRLINMLTIVDYECDGDCENCEFYEDCDESKDDTYLNNGSTYVN